VAKNLAANPASIAVYLDGNQTQYSITSTDNSWLLAFIYTHLAEELFKGENEYVSKVAKNEKDVCTLIDAGFEYVCDFEEHKIFRKRKY
jgi:hypothetical protein